MMGVIAIPQAFAQTTVNVTETTPCFLDYNSTGLEMWQNCGADDDFLAITLQGWEWVTGGLFSMIVVAILCIMTWIKYHTIIYPLAIGIIMLPTSYYLFPEQFLSYVFVMAALAIASLVYTVFIKRTKDY
jgi:hypothetical protein